MITIVWYVLRQSHENNQSVIHKMRNTAHEILNGEVITIPIMENSHTDLEEIALVGRDANNCPHRDQGYGYQYSQPQRGGYRRRFG